MTKRSIKKEKKNTYYDQLNRSFQNTIVIFEYINVVLLAI